VRTAHSQDFRSKVQALGVTRVWFMKIVAAGRVDSLEKWLQRCSLLQILKLSIIRYCVVMTDSFKSRLDRFWSSA